MATTLFSAAKRHHLYCNSTSCPSREALGTDDEDALVDHFRSIKLFKCSKCKYSYYCHKDCQVYDWKEGGHKEKCALNCAGRETINNLKRENKPMEFESARMNKHTPAVASEAYVPPTMGRGKVVTSGRKTNKILNMATTTQKQTLDYLTAMTSMQQVMSDAFDRIAKGLPPRGGSFMYSCPVDMIANGTSEENVEIWQLPANKFKSWMWRVAKEGLDFEGLAKDSLNRVENSILGVQLLEEWEPTPATSPAWACHSEAIIITSLVAAICHQKYYLDRILPPTGSLHGVVQLLHRWVRWEGPVVHEWNLYMSLIFSALLSGVELTKESYNVTIDPSLLAGLLPVSENLVRVFGKDPTRREPYEPDDDDLRNPQEAFANFSGYYTTKVFRELNTCIRARELFPQLKLAPLKKLVTVTRKNLGTMPWMDGRRTQGSRQGFSVHCFGVGCFTAHFLSNLLVVACVVRSTSD